MRIFVNAAALLPAQRTAIKPAGLACSQRAAHNAFAASAALAWQTRRRRWAGVGSGGIGGWRSGVNGGSNNIGSGNQASALGGIGEMVDKREGVAKIGGGWRKSGIGERRGASMAGEGVVSMYVSSARRIS
jgi:hypothetical protein